jgi:hypothetical protein
MPGNLMKSDAALKIIVAGAVFLVITRQAGGSARLTDRMTVSDAVDGSPPPPQGICG